MYVLNSIVYFLFFFFFQAEDGIRDRNVTGVQTCALPIYLFIVMPSANLADAVSTAVKARVINNGQSCIAAKRFIVAEQIADDFERNFVTTMEALNIGDPMDPATDLGPLASAAAVAGLDADV